MQYLEVAFSMGAAMDWKQDLLIQALGEIGFDSFQKNDPGFLAYIPEAGFDIVALETLIQEFPYPLNTDYQIRRIEPENWNTRWEENFQPLVLAEQVYIRAPFHPARPELPWEVVIHPKMAFGTGHHQTTALMLEYILQTAPSAMRVLDVGAGTGILGILCAKMGARSVTALDNDPVCVESISENSVLNGTSIIQRQLGSIESVEGSFDLIMANINRNTLILHFPLYRKALHPGGILLVSGFYDGKDFEIIKTEAAANGLQYVDHKTRDKWVAAKFKL